ncbi:MAG: hypothetical protein LBI88_02920 [Deltaproteobacteria bacterium]|jgi:hypothetical protein|nr:hypothetical protein [Deltaproteobacteria bacterium]
MDVEKQISNSTWIQALQRLCDDKEALFQILDKLPIPLEVFAPDGR